MARQARAKRGPASFALAGLALALASLGACRQGDAEGGDCPASVKAHAVSGFCIPRYVSLKRGEVYGRKGPGKDYPALWIYRARGLPVQVVAETAEWRRICDPDGGAAWINRSMVDGHRTVISLGAGPLGLLRQPRADSKAAALLVPRALANLGDCRGGWCRLSVGGVSGWAPAQRLWGVALAPQCR